MRKQRPSVILLTICGVMLMGIGGYFILLRPALLPEDLRYIGVHDPVQAFAGLRLTAWLQKVFWVLGGYIFTSGLYTVYIAHNLLQRKTGGNVALIAIAGSTSVGWMAFVNILLGSNFMVPLIVLAGLWASALLLFSIGR